MKLKDILSKSQNSINKQSIWNPKKKKIRRLGLTEEDILNIKIDDKFLKRGKR